MRFVSTVGRSPAAPLAEALRRGLAPDGGLYVPADLAPMPVALLARLSGADWRGRAAEVANQLLGDDLAPELLRRLLAEALDFPVPLKQLRERVYLLELFHGPTLAFKDVGARVLARLLQATGDGSASLTVLVATSGDTGGAVAQAFHGVAGTRVAVLYPQGRVSDLQERQFATLGGNVRALAVDGTFDDCQRLAKAAFADHELAAEIGLTSANSINVGRLLPQIFYYFHAAAEVALREPGRRRLLFSVPSGNLGNLTAGLMARRLGLEARFVAATNANDSVRRYLAEGAFTPRPSQRTLSTAMDVGDPGNRVRIEHLYRNNLQQLRRDLSAATIDDEATRAAILEVDRRHGYLMDPHTAVGYQALIERLADEPEDTVGVVLCTAHPAKFRDALEPVVGRRLELPPRLQSVLRRPLRIESVSDSPDELARRLRDRG